MRGFSLVELIVSLSLLFGVLVLTVNIYPTSMLALANARQKAAADALSQEVIERCLAGDTDMVDGYSIQTSDGRTTYSIALSMAPQVDASGRPCAGLFLDTVTVRWRDGRGNDQVRAHTALICRGWF